MRKAYTLLGWTIIAFACISLLCRGLLPLFLPAPIQIKQWIVSHSPYPIDIENVVLSFEGISPSVTLSQVRMINDGSNAFFADNIRLRFNVAQWLFRQLQIEELAIDGAHFSINYDPQSASLSIRGFPLFTLPLNIEGSSLPLIKRWYFTSGEVELFLGEENRHLLFTKVGLAVEIDHLIKLHGEANIENSDSVVTLIAKASTKNLQNQYAVYMKWQKGDLKTLGSLLPALPIQVQGGQANIQAWLKQKNNHALEIVTDIDLANLKISERPFDHIHGLLRYEQKGSDWVIHGYDWQIEQRPLDFVLKKSAQAGRAGAVWEFLTTQFDIDFFYPLANLEQLPAKFNHLLKMVGPHGIIDYAHLEVEQQTNTFNILVADVVFRDFQLQSGDMHPGLFPFSGAMSFNEGKGKMLLQSEKMTIEFPALWDQKLDMSDVKTLFGWQKIQKEWHLTLFSHTSKIKQALLEGVGTIIFAQEKSPIVDLNLHLGTLKVTDFLDLLPRRKMDKQLLEWLDSALLGGDIISTHAILRGDLKDFPFHHAEGLFEVESILDHIHLHYIDKWPALEDLKANLQIHNQALTINGESATIAEGKLHFAKAFLSDFSVLHPRILLESKITNRLENGLKVIQESPLQATFMKALAPFSFNGEMDLLLQLNVPLSLNDTQEMDVKGLMGFNHAMVTMNDWKVGIKALKGQVAFTQDSITSRNIKGLLFDHPMQFSIQNNSKIKEGLSLTAQGNIGMDKLQQWFDFNSKILSGETDFIANMALSEPNADIFQTSITLFSSLKGVEIMAPSPLGKLAFADKPIEITLTNASPSQWRVGIACGQDKQDFNATLHFLQTARLWRLLGGNIHFGSEKRGAIKEDKKVDKIFLVNGNLGTVEFQEWKSFLANFANNFTQSAEGDSFIPKFALNIEELNLYGMTFPKTFVAATWDQNKSLINFNFDGHTIKGQVTVPKDNSRDIVIDLQKLILTKNSASLPFSAGSFSREFNPISIKIKECKFNNKVFSAIQARVEPSWKGCFFPNIKAKMKSTEIDFSGSWDFLALNNNVKFEGKIITRNIGDTLHALGMANSLRHAIGEGNFMLEWQGSPITMDYPSLGGQAEVILKKGTIHGVNPGIGRLLSLFNIDNVKRRLNLDFSDVTRKSFPFDEIKGKFQFGKGKISANKIVLNGPSAKIFAFGQTDLENQGIHAEMVVMPNVTGTLPVAAAIAAGNPAVGAAVWVADKMLGKKIQEIHRYRYRILGTWQTPIVEEIPTIPMRG